MSEDARAGAGARAGEPGRRRVRAVVVGGGISGLAAAWSLVGRDDVDDVVVLERSGRAGGVLAGGELAGVPVDVGAEALLARRPEALGLAREVGLGDELVFPGTTSAAVLSRGRLVRVPATTVMGVPRDPASLAELLSAEELARALEEPDRPAPPLSGDVDVASWVGTRFGRAVVDRLVDPLLGGVYAGRADQLSLRATLPAVWELATLGGSVVEAFAARGARPAHAAGGAGASSSLAPGAAQAPPAPPGPVFAGVRGGVHRLATATAEAIEKAGGELRYGTTVRGLERTPVGFRILTGASTSPSWVEAELVIVAVPAPAAARLLGVVAPAAAAELGEVQTASLALVSAVVDGAVLSAGSALPPGPITSGLLVPPVEGFTIKASTFSSVKWPWLQEHLHDGRQVLRVSLGRAGEQADLQRDDPDLSALALRELGTVLGGGPVTPHAVQVQRWGGSLPQYAVGHVDRVARIRSAVADVPGLGIAGSVLDGVGVPACISAAGLAVTQACGSRQPPVAPGGAQETMSP